MSISQLQYENISEILKGEASNILGSINSIVSVLPQELANEFRTSFLLNYSSFERLNTYVLERLKGEIENV